jgi:predicted nucleic acid-binding Zn ribbon protein
VNPERQREREVLIWFALCTLSVIAVMILGILSWL